MAEKTYVDLNRRAWDADSKNYQEKHRKDLNLNLTDIVWGFGESKESELSLLGDVSGKTILELGCGGAQCSIPLSRLNAFCIGLDISKNQLRCAKDLLASENAHVSLILANGEILPFLDESFDIAFCVFGAIGFVDIRVCFKEVFRVLHSGGFFSFSWYHPFFDCFAREGKNQLEVVRSYFDKSPIIDEKKRDDGSVITYVEVHHTLSEWFNTLKQVGFLVVDIIEPRPSVNNNHEATTWSEAEPSKIKKIPSSIIWKAQKPSMHKGTN